MVQYLPVQVTWGQVLVCNTDTSYEHAGMLSLDGSTHFYTRYSPMNFSCLTTLSTKELNDSILVLFGKILHLECWHLSMSHFFLFSLMCPFCCTSCGQLLVCCDNLQLVALGSSAANGFHLNNPLVY